MNSILAKVTGLKNWFSRCIYRPHAEPVFVLGNQKSGTTVIAALLAKAIGKPATLDFFHHSGPEDVVRYARGQLSLERIVRKNVVEFSRPIIKEPDLTFFVEDINRKFPLSPVVFIVRDPINNIRSILNRLTISGQETHLTVDQFGRLPLPWRILISLTSIPKKHQITDLQVRSEPNKVFHLDALIYRWAACANLVSNLSSRVDTHTVRYEDFVNDKTGCIARLVDRLGMHQINDVSEMVEKQYQPNTILESATGFFSEFNDNLIRQRLDPFAVNLGYEVKQLK